MSETVEQITKQELDALRTGSTMLFHALNGVYKLHELGQATGDNDETVDVCLHCSEIAGEDKGIYYPCPTVDYLLQYFVVAPESSEEEETPAE